MGDIVFAQPACMRAVFTKFRSLSMTCHTFHTGSHVAVNDVAIFTDNTPPDEKLCRFRSRIYSEFSK